MSILRIDGASLECVEQISSKLKEIGNIDRFSVFFEDIPAKYSDIPSYYLNEDGRWRDKKTTYLLILESLESDQEVWIEGATCGYGGTGPGATIEILQILGVRMDFNRITTEKVIEHENVNLEHDLNFIIRQKADDYEVSDLNNEKLMKVMMKFKNPYDKWTAKDTLRILGYFQPLRHFGDSGSESYYFRTPYDTTQEMSKYATNNVLTLHKRLSNIAIESIDQLIRQIAHEYHAEVITRKYERTPQ